MEKNPIGFKLLVCFKAYAITRLLLHSLELEWGRHFNHT